MTLPEKLRYLKEKHPEIYEVLEVVVPNLIADPTHPSEEDLDQYNFWIDSIDIDEAQPIYHLLP